MDALCRRRGFEATWRRPHWSLSPRCLSLSRPVPPSVCAASKRRLSHLGATQETHMQMKTLGEADNDDKTDEELLLSDFIPDQHTDSFFLQLPEINPPTYGC